MQSSPKPTDPGGHRTASRLVWKSASGIKGPVSSIGCISNTQSGRDGRFVVALEAGARQVLEME